jgi:hypothetical protein
MILARETPIERAASTTPGSTLIRFCSTMRATANIAPMVIAKIAALGPRRVPTTSSVTGPSAARRMMNGIGRTKFTTTLSTSWTARCSRMLPRRVT